MYDFKNNTTPTHDYDNYDETNQNDGIKPSVSSMPKLLLMEKMLLYLLYISICLILIVIIFSLYYASPEFKANQTSPGTAGINEKTIVPCNAPQEEIKITADSSLIPNTPDLKRYLDLSEVNALITFDDGPHPDTTPYLVELLKANKVPRAIFFLVGYRILEYPHLVSLIESAGYDIGYHSMFHENLATFSTKKIEQDIQNFRKVLNVALGKDYPIKWGRPPFGGMTKATTKIFLQMEKNGRLANTRGEELNSRLIKNNIIIAFDNQQLNILLWNVDFDDWKLSVNTKIVGRSYSPAFQQIWLFHERPVDWINFKGFDNSLEKTFQDFLNKLNEAYLSSMTVRRIQEVLNELSYNPGQIDGILGDETLSAIQKFRQEIELPEDENLSLDLLLEALFLRIDPSLQLKSHDLVGS